MINYFKIREKINCGSCNGVNDTMLIACSYCGNNFHATGASAQVLAVKEKIDNYFAHGDFADAKEAITQLSDVTNPILHFRAIIIDFNDTITAGSIDAARVRKQLDALSSLPDSAEDYFKAYTRYIHNILPYADAALDAEAYRSITGHELVLQYDNKGLFTEAFKLQFAAATLTEEQVKEIKFYLDPDNQMADSAFNLKKKYILDIYNQTTQNL